jgi:hypothetical protein
MDSVSDSGVVAAAAAAAALRPSLIPLRAGPRDSLMTPAEETPILVFMGEPPDDVHVLLDPVVAGLLWDNTSGEPRDEDDDCSWRAPETSVKLSDETEDDGDGERLRDTTNDPGVVGKTVVPVVGMMVGEIAWL